MPEAPAEKKPKHPRDPFREAVETVVFVVVLVLLLKLFVTEAFVIPTGSMATTLPRHSRSRCSSRCSRSRPTS